MARPLVAAPRPPTSFGETMRFRSSFALRLCAAIAFTASFGSHAALAEETPVSVIENVDINHPLAGQELHFDMKVLGVE